MSTLAEYRAKLLELLDDESQANYSNDYLDQGLRQALTDYNRFLPLPSTYIIDAEGTYRITLPSDFVALEITRVEKLSSHPSVLDSLKFKAAWVDESWILEFDTQISSTDDLTIYYLAPHFIENLDSGTSTTIPDVNEDQLARGAAAYAMLIRSHSVSEDNNLVPATPAVLRTQANKWLNEYHSFLTTHSRSGKFVTWTYDIDTNF